MDKPWGNHEGTMDKPLIKPIVTSILYESCALIIVFFNNSAVTDKKGVSLYYLYLLGLPQTDVNY